AGLLGHQRILEHHLGDAGDFLTLGKVLDAAELLAAVLEEALAAAAGVDLRLEHDRAAGLVERLHRLDRGGGHKAPRHGRPGGGQKFFRLVFVNLHRAVRQGSDAGETAPGDALVISVAPRTDTRSPHSLGRRAGVLDGPNSLGTNDPDVGRISNPAGSWPDWQ